MTEPITAFTIDRRTWLYGTHAERARPEWQSMLYRPADGRSCCLGLYLQACGVDPRSLEGRWGPREVAPVIPEQARWLLELVPSRSIAWSGEPNPPRTEDSADATAAMPLNDSDEIDQSDREAEIAAIFARHGITVSFTGEDIPPDSPDQRDDDEPDEDEYWREITRA